MPTVEKRDPETLLRIYGKLGPLLKQLEPEVAGERAKVPSYDYLLWSYAVIPDLIEEGQLEVAFERLYGIAIGITGLSVRWRPPNFEVMVDRG